MSIIKIKDNKDFLYSEPEDHDLPYKIYKKREFYFNRVPKRDIMTNYDDVQKYRESVCNIGDYQPREQQNILPNFINQNTPYKGVILMHGTGSGKCHKRDTPILMFNHSIKMIQNIQIGELVMGEDGFSRTVIHTTVGHDILYKIVPKENTANIYYVNLDHILCLCDNNGNHIQVPVKDFIKFNNKEDYKGYRVIIKDITYKKRYEILLDLLHKSCILVDNYYKIEDTYILNNIKSFKYLIGSCGLYLNEKTNTIYGFDNLKPYAELKETINYIYYNFTIQEDYFDNYYGIAINKDHKYLLGDFTVTHNSCTAIAIAEQFKDQIKKYNTKIYVLVPGPNTRENFKKELLNCTGNTYLTNKDEFIQMSRTDIDRAKQNAINIALQNYKILSYKTFYKKVLGEKIQEKKIVNNTKLKSSYKKTEAGEYEREIVINRINNMNNSVLIVDEAHNITGNEYGEALKKIIKNSDNLRIILLTATPMINLPDEIVDLLNFIRPIDDQIERDKVFIGDKNYKMKIKPGGLEYLQEKARGYISFYRGNIPYTFAKRVDKGVIPHGLLFTPVIKCFMNEFQYNGYLDSKKNEGDTLDRGSLAAANFVFPILDSNNNIIGHSSLEGINILIAQVNEQYDKLINSINKNIYNNKLSKDLLKNFIVVNNKNISGNILKLPYIKDFSIKFYKILNRIAKNIISKKGPCTSFIYSNLVKAGGIELFAETLLMNGYIEYQEDGNYDIKDDTLDYKYGLRFIEFKKKFNSNEFKPATFLLVTGGAEEGEDVPEIKQKIIRDVFNNIDNIDGKHIKFILGSKVMNEGVTLNNCKQVHILDVFYNIPKIEQVIGRAIRMCVHQSSINDNNKFPKVYVYRYVIALNNKDLTELSTDEILYQKAELKYLTVKQIERILKEIAFDCALLLHANMFPEELEKYKDCDPYRENMSAKEIKNMCPALCDFQKCDLKCNSLNLNKNFWNSKNKTYRDLNKNEIDYNTFTDELSKNEIILIKNKIKDLYRFKYVYLYDELLEVMQKSFLEHQVELFDNYFLDQALEDLMPNDFNNFKDTIYDKFNRPGYLIQRKKYYIFQPFNENETLPTYYRDTIQFDIDNHVSLNNYIKQNYPSIKYDITNTSIKNKDKDKDKYDFDSVLDYYNNRDEYDFVGVIDKNNNKLASSNLDLFKIRPKQQKQNTDIEKKRGTGIYNFKGAVCSTAKSKPELLKIVKDLPNVNKDEIKMVDKLSREDICNFIRDKLLFLEKYSVSNDNNKVTYIMVPNNHPTIPFPLNLEDRIKYIISNINKIVGRNVDIIVKKYKNDKNLLSYELTFINEKFIADYISHIERLGFIINNNIWKLNLD